MYNILMLTVQSIKCNQELLFSYKYHQEQHKKILQVGNILKIQPTSLMITFPIKNFICKQKCNSHNGSELKKLRIDGLSQKPHAQT